MTTCIALLRGVNVGKAKRVPMADLRDLLAGLGFTDVATLLNSGNEVFRARSGATRAIASDIAAAIARRLKVEVPVIVKSAREFDSIVVGNPFSVAAADYSRFLVAFTQRRADLAALSALEPLVGPQERFTVGPEAAYLYCAGGILESRAAEALLGKLGRSATTRNLATTLKLHGLAQGDR